MRLKRAVLLLVSSAVIAPAAAQQGQQNPNQAAGKAILQAADNAMTMIQRKRQVQVSREVLVPDRGQISYSMKIIA